MYTNKQLVEIKFLFMYLQISKYPKLLAYID